MSASTTAPEAPGAEAPAFELKSQRDTQLVIDELLNGGMSTEFVYQIPGRDDVSGISVIGARQLAAVQGHIRHRIVMSVEKKGPLAIITTYPMPGVPARVEYMQVPGPVTTEDDFYRVLVEVENTATGYVLQDEKTELRWQTSKEGKPYQNAHFATVAQAKAFRNAVEHVFQQDIVLDFVRQALEMKRANKDGKTIVGGAMEEMRRAITRFAAEKGIPIERAALGNLTSEQMGGLREAVKDGKDSFLSALAALGLRTAASAETAAPPKPAPKAAGNGGGRRADTSAGGGAAGSDGSGKKSDAGGGQPDQGAGTSDQGGGGSAPGTGEPALITHEKTIEVDLGGGQSARAPASAGPAAGDGRPKQAAFGELE